MELNHKQLDSLIKIAYSKKKPLMITGGIGIGKSVSVKTAAKTIASQMGKKYSENPKDINNPDKFCLIDIRVSQLEPSDMRGLPKIDKNSTRWVLPNWLPKTGQGIIMLDELNLAFPSILSSAYQLILDRRLGDYILPEGYTVFAAGNRIEDKANIFELPAPLANRFIHCELAVPTREEWVNWALNNDIDNRIISFINFNSKYLYSFNSKYSDKAFSTPRTLEMASSLIKNEKDMDTVDMLVASTLGEAFAVEFGAYLKIANKIDVQKILDNKEEFPLETSKRYAVITKIAEKYKEKPEKVAASMLGLALRIEPEYSILLLHMCKNTERSTELFAERLKNADEDNYSKIAATIGKYLI